MTFAISLHVPSQASQWSNQLRSAELYRRSSSHKCEGRKQPLCWAAHKQNMCALIQLLPYCNMTTVLTVLCTVVEVGNEDAEDLLKEVANPKCGGIITADEKHDKHILCRLSVIAASGRGHFQIIKSLLEYSPYLMKNYAGMVCSYL
ncbi:hypothetical protein BDW71DRAFT_94305 [Aspergillus fruticulosus]